MALNNPRRLICHQIKKPNQTFSFFFLSFLSYYPVMLFYLFPFHFFLLMYFTSSHLFFTGFHLNIFFVHFQFLFLLFDFPLLLLRYQYVFSILHRPTLRSINRPNICSSRTTDAGNMCEEHIKTKRSGHGIRI